MSGDRKNQLNVVPTAAEIQKYIDDSSNFGFELKVLNVFSKFGFSCMHSGNFADPLTEKFREFDLIAIKSIGNCHVKLCIETTKVTLPYLVYRRARLLNESGHDLIAIDRTRSSLEGTSVIVSNVPRTLNNYIVKIKDGFGRYNTGDMVGKRVEQIKVNVSHSARFLENSNGDPHKKAEQAIASASWSGNLHLLKSNPKGILALVPIVVVPDGMLFTVDYDENGNRTTEVLPAISVPVSSPRLLMASSEIPFVLTHYELVTIGGIGEMLKYLLSDINNSGETPMFQNFSRLSNWF